MATIHYVARAGAPPRTVSRVRSAVAALEYDLNAGVRTLRSPTAPAADILMGDPSCGDQTRVNRALMVACLEDDRRLTAKRVKGETVIWQGHSLVIRESTGPARAG